MDQEIVRSASLFSSSFQSVGMRQEFLFSKFSELFNDT